MARVTSKEAHIQGELLNCIVLKIERWSRTCLATLTFFTQPAQCVLLFWEIPPCFDFYLLHVLTLVAVLMHSWYTCNSDAAIYHNYIIFHLQGRYASSLNKSEQAAHQGSSGWFCTIWLIAAPPPHPKKPHWLSLQQCYQSCHDDIN